MPGPSEKPEESYKGFASAGQWGAAVVSGGVRTESDAQPHDCPAARAGEAPQGDRRRSAAFPVTPQLYWEPSPTAGTSQGKGRRNPARDVLVLSRQRLLSDHSCTFKNWRWLCR